MTKIFEFLPEQLEKAHKALEGLGFKDEERRVFLIEHVQKNGAVHMFGFGSTLHEPFQGTTKKVAAHAKDAGVRFSQAFGQYGGENYSNVMLALDRIEGEKAFGSIQSIDINSAEEFIKYFDDLQIRENPVNNPIYKFDETITAFDNDGNAYECLTCFSNIEGPLYIGNETTKNGLSATEVAIILAHSMGSEVRMNTGEFRKNGFLNLDQLMSLVPSGGYTSGVYFLEYKKAHDNPEWGFDKNPYLEEVQKEFLAFRRDMAPETKKALDDRESKLADIKDPSSISLKFEEVSEELVPKRTPEEVTEFYLKTRNKIENMLISNPVYRTWAHNKEWKVENDIAHPQIPDQESVILVDHKGREITPE